MRITDIKIKVVKKDEKVKGIADIVLDDEFCIHGIKILENQKGLFIAFPFKIDKKGKYKDLVHPINSETREKIQNAILTEYKEISNQG